MLSPKLFNKYLEHALLSSPALASAVARGDIIAYADDIVILSKSKAMMERILDALEALQDSHGLSINKKKTVFISNKKEYRDLHEIRGIMRV